MVSMDNCLHNGTKLYDAVSTFADKWVENKLVDATFAEYIKSTESILPWSMIDKITPRPDPSVANSPKGRSGRTRPCYHRKIRTLLLLSMRKNVNISSLKIAFPNGRPALEKGGLMFTARETVDKVEKMKVCTCLNPLHTALAVFGCLLGYDLISKEMKDETLKKLVEGIGYKEGTACCSKPWHSGSKRLH